MHYIIVRTVVLWETAGSDQEAPLHFLWTWPDSTVIIVAIDSKAVDQNKVLWNTWSLLFVNCSSEDILQSW